jgi:hypothetical protein
VACPIEPWDCVGNVAKSVARDAFSSIAHDFGTAAAGAIDWLWSQIQSATAVSLHGRGFDLDIGIVATIAGTVAVGLFALQLIIGTVRRDPGALARAARGLVVAFIGGGASIAVVTLLLAAVDDLSAGVVQAATGGSIEQMGHDILTGASISAATQNPAGLMLLSLAALVSVVIVWAALVVRKILIIVTAVFAPLAFAGSLADITASWTRRWIETTVALVVSKLILVIIFVCGLGILVDGVGQAGSGTTQTITQVVSGMLVLALAGFAPWLALKLVHFVGDQTHHLHLLATTSTAGAQRAYSAAQKAQPWAMKAAGVGGSANGFARQSSQGSQPGIGPLGSPTAPSSIGQPGWFHTPTAAGGTSGWADRSGSGRGQPASPTPPPSPPPSTGAPPGSASRPVGPPRTDPPA